MLDLANDLGSRLPVSVYINGQSGFELGSGVKVLQSLAWIYDSHHTFEMALFAYAVARAYCQAPSPRIMLDARRLASRDSETT